MSGIIPQDNRQRLTNGGFDFGGNRNAPHGRTVGVLFLGTFHQLGIINLKHAVMVTHRRRDSKTHGVATNSFRKASALAIGHFANGSRHPAANFDPKVNLVAQGQPAGEFYRHESFVPVIGRYAADKQATVIGAPVTHHIFAGTVKQIRRGKVAVKNLCQIIAG